MTSSNPDTAVAPDTETGESSKLAPLRSKAIVQRLKYLTSFGCAVAAFCCGFSPVMQFVLISDVGTKMDNPFWSALVLNAFSWAIFVFLGFSHGPSLETTKQSIKAAVSQSRWSILTFFTGLSGGFMICSAPSVSPKIGVALYFVLLVCSQMAFSFFIELMGLCWFPKLQRKWTIALGTLGVIVGTVLFGSTSVAVSSSLKSLPAGTAAAYLFLACGAGVALTFLPIGNRKVATMLGTPFRAICWSLTLSTSVALIASLITQPNAPLHFLSATDYLKLLGGSCYAGGAFLGIVYLPSVMGLAATVSCATSGQLSFSLLVDSVGLFGAKTIPPTMFRILGVCIVFVGVVIIQIGRRPTASGVIESTTSAVSDLERSTILTKEVSKETLPRDGSSCATSPCNNIVQPNSEREDNHNAATHRQGINATT